MAVVLLLGFSSGIPLALSGATLQAWLKTEHVDLGTIGLFSVVGMPYAYKFLWAPFMDRFVPPGSRSRRRGWLLVTQIALVAAIAALGTFDPAHALLATAISALCVAFFSASQDIVIDAYRTELLPEAERGLGSAAYILGYRLAMLVSGALALILADHVPWRLVYQIMACAMGVGVLATLWAPEPAVSSPPPKSLLEAIYLPLVEFFRRPGWAEVLLFVFLYKLDASLATSLTTPFMMDLGFTLTEIGVVTKWVGMGATIGGGVLGGALMVRFGLRRSLWIFGFAQSIANLTFMGLAHMGHHYPSMVMAIVVDFACSGMATVAFSAFLMGLCDTRFTATQYALLTSVMALTRIAGGSISGYLAKAVGWETFFLISTLIALPSFLLLLRFPKWRTSQFGRSEV